MSKLVFICGKVGTGKTTFAQKLKSEMNAITFSADEWMLHFFEEHLPRQEFDRRLNQCIELIYRTCEQILEKNINVILDFGFWRRLERDCVRERFKKFEVAMYYINIDPQKNWDFIKKRNEKLDEKTYEITRDTYDELSSFFEEPSEDEDYFEAGSTT